MFRTTLALAAALFAAPLAAQGLFVPPTPVDQAKIFAAAQAAAQAVVPPVCSDAPMSDTLTASTGTAAPCVPRADNTRATQVQRKPVTTASDGTFSGSWDVPWTTSPAVTWANANTTADPYICQVATWTTSTFSGKCWRMTANTLPAVLTALPGLVVSPFVVASGGVPVSVGGRQ